MIESLLKLKCQQALAQGDYDSLSSYSLQLVMFQQGTLIGELPIGEELKVLNKVWAQFGRGEVPVEGLVWRFEQVYGEDLTKVCLHFLKHFNSAGLVGRICV
jgi:hypothetical protein